MSWSSWFSRDPEHTQTHEDVTADEPDTVRVTWPIKEDDTPYNPRDDSFGWI
jgi:hypothetical protein